VLEHKPLFIFWLVSATSPRQTTDTYVDHLPLHRQQEMFLRHGVEISRKTMEGWMAKCAALLGPLWECANQYLFQSRTFGTDNTPVKVLSPKLDFARTGRMWPMSGTGAPECGVRLLPSLAGCSARH
jgi:hypothetical protein